MRKHFGTRSVFKKYNLLFDRDKKLNHLQFSYMLHLENQPLPVNWQKKKKIFENTWKHISKQMIRYLVFILPSPLTLPSSQFIARKDQV